jgi:hypothetical protein
MKKYENAPKLKMSKSLKLFQKAALSLKPQNLAILMKNFKSDEYAESLGEATPLEFQYNVYKRIEENKQDKLKN